MRRREREGMRRKTVCLFLLCVMFSLVWYIPTASAQSGPLIDLLRYKVVQRVPEALASMFNGTADAWNDVTNLDGLEMLDKHGFTTTSASGFHAGFITFNIRDLADPNVNYGYRPELIDHFWPLHDAEFRHATFHCFDQLKRIQTYYGYIVTPIHSLVPPAQGKYYNSNALEHPYNPGNPFTSPAGEHSSCGILKAAGYTFVDADNSGAVTNADYWKCPDGSAVPYMRIWWPIIFSWDSSVVTDIGKDLRVIGLGATSLNGFSGFQAEGHDFNEYLNLAYGTKTSSGGWFDAFLVFYSLGRIPDHLYALCHSSQDTTSLWGARNAAGVNDTIIDALVETVKYGLDLDAMEAAAKQAQEMLFDPALPNADNYALSHMMLYSRTYFDSYNPNLRGIINSHGFGSENAWTFLNLDWVPGFERQIDSRSGVISILYRKPVSLNPLYASSGNEWDILNRVFDGLITVNPYNHNDVPWLASDWAITQTTTGMDIDFTLRNDVTWQDGKPFTAYDVEFCLEFIKAHSVPRYQGTWSALEDVVVTDADTFTIQCNREGIGLFYDFAALATMIPEHIWNRTWSSDEAVLNYDPTEAYNVAPGYTAGPNPPPTNLFGTGLWRFQFYNGVDMEYDLYANTNHFMTQAEVQTLLSDMFWEVGDYNRDAIINILDLTPVSLAFGSKMGSPRYNPDADFNSDGIIDTRDLRTAAFRLSSQKEYP